MRYQQLPPFEKQLQEAFPDHLSPIYMVVAQDSFERKNIIKNILAILQKKEVSLSTIFHEAGAQPVEKTLEQLNTRSLFGGCTAVVLEGIEKLKKAEGEVLASYLERPARFSYLILGGSSLKSLPGLYQKGKKEVVLVDLSEEKPWDRQRRLKEWVIVQAAKEKKAFSSEAAAQLLEQIGPDLPTLEQELLKLLCFIGERNRIELKDVQTICSSRTVATGWQISEAIVWGGKPLQHDHMDLSALLALVGQIRYQLQIGHQIGACLEQGVKPHELAGYFPTLKPQMLDKYVGEVKKRKADFFARGLQSLFNLELACKSSSSDPKLLFDLFISKLYASSLS